MSTPLGPARIAATAQGLGGFWFDDQAHHPGRLDAPEDPGHRWLAQAREALAAYWQDAGAAPVSVPLDLGGTPFQAAVWAALLRIPCGQQASYGELARQIGRPQAVRALGAAVGRNPVSILVPCHRVLGSDGSLTGYAGGLHRKRELLRREATQRVGLECNL